ncbi:MAG TPA: (d)CMP kinase [Longimicrobiales bacterium]|nr:(d)CMP kinase [Longimicrobiales bacterium]
MAEPPRGPIVTVDGPAGSGKSTTARAVARRLGLRHLDSGALYRALTLALLESGVAEEDWPSLGEDDLAALDVSLRTDREAFRIRVAGREVDDELRSEAVTSRVSAVARIPAVRATLLGLQREAGRHGSLVADGRDMGTVVFPEADVKVFLVADLGERARRRLLERTGREPTPREVDAEADALARRDRSDSLRSLSPLRRPEDALDVDTTRLGFEEQVDAVVRRVRALTGERRGGGSPPGDGPGPP